MKLKSYLLFTLMLLLSLNFSLSPGILSGTLIETPNGLIPINNLNVGDQVISYDSNIEDYVEIKIIEIVKETTDVIVIIETSEGIIFANPNLSFYEPKIDEWLMACELARNNVLADCDFAGIFCHNVEYLWMPNTVTYKQDSDKLLKDLI